mgnify:CR=1 FL=1
MTYSSSDFSGAEFDALTAKQASFDDAEREVRSTFYDAVVELFEIDLSTLNKGDYIVVEGTLNYYFCNFVVPTPADTQEGAAKPIWRRSETNSAEQVYEPIPILASGYERTTKGQIPQPEITVSNVFGALSGLIASLDDLVGTRVFRRRTLGKYLGNFTTKDFDIFFPTDIFYIERKVSENNLSVTFQLASPFDVEGLMLPRRVVTHNHCLWVYRSTECGYGNGRSSELNGLPIANSLDSVAKSGDLFYDNASTSIQNYLDAVAAWQVAVVDQRNKQAARNLAERKKDNACNEDEVSVTRQYSWDADDGGTDFSGEFGYFFNTTPTFALVETTTDPPLPICIVWEGVSIPSDQIGSKYRVRDDKDGRNANGYASNSIEFMNVYNYSSNVNNNPPSFNDTGLSPTFALYPEDRNSGPVYAFENGVFHLESVDPDFEATDDEDEIFIKQDQTSVSYGLREVEELEEQDLTNCNTQTLAFNTADADLTTANTTLTNARALIDTRYGQLTAAEQNKLRDQFDICGKRLTSCQMRFGETQLPFGGFPGSNTARQ